MRCCAMAPTFKSAASASRRIRSRTLSRGSIGSLRSRPDASLLRAALMRHRSHLRVHDGARDPLLPRGPRAQQTVWGRALRNAIWGITTPNGRLATTQGIAHVDLHPSLSHCHRPEGRLDNLSSWAGLLNPKCFRDLGLGRTHIAAQELARLGGMLQQQPPIWKSLKKMLRRPGYRFFFEETVRTLVVLTDAVGSTVALTASPGWRRESLHGALLSTRPNSLEAGLHGACRR